MQLHKVNYRNDINKGRKKGGEIQQKTKPHSEVKCKDKGAHIFIDQV